MTIAAAPTKAERDGGAGTALDAALDAVIETVVAPGAAEVDRDGTYPKAAIEALAGAGVLGLVSAEEVGGHGAGIAAAARVVERLAGACGSTAMVVLMHYVATAVIEAAGPRPVREAIAAGEHLTSLAFSEAGSRSHFWVPIGTATADPGGGVRLDARKSWVTSAGEADSYVWSSRPLRGDGPVTLWLVPSDTGGLRVDGGFDGLGLRGNASRPVTAEAALVGTEAMLGADGAGLELAMHTALPFFVVLSAAFSLGLMEALTAEAGAHLTRTRLAHLGQTLAEQPVQRAALARLRIRTDQVRAFLLDTIAAVEAGRDDEILRVLEVKAVAAEAATEVADGAMRLCGGAAFRKELGIERRFRDALAARVMAPTTDALHDFIGRVCCGLPLFDGAPPA